MKRGGNTWLQGGKRPVLTAASTSVSSEKQWNHSIRICSCSFDYKEYIAKLALDWCIWVLGQRAQARLTAQDVPMFLSSFYPQREENHQYTIAILSNSAKGSASLLQGLSQLSPTVKTAFTLTLMEPDQICSMENSKNSSCCIPLLCCCIPPCTALLPHSHDFVLCFFDIS